MEFDKSKVYTTFNCDEVKIGSKGYFADDKESLIRRVKSENQNLYWTLDEINSHTDDFVFSAGEYTYRYFYLVEEPKEKTTRLTYYELSQLLKCFGVELNYYCNTWSYTIDETNKELPEGYKIRYKQCELEEPTRETVWKWWGKQTDETDISRFISFIGWNIDKE